MKRIIGVSWTLGALLLAACGGAGAGGAGATSGGEEQYAGPIASTDTARGQQIYEASCNGCHPGADAGYGPRVRDIHWTAAHMRKQIREGKGRMPSFGTSDIDAEGLECLLAYLASVGAVQAE